MLNIFTQNTRGLKDKEKIDFLEKQLIAIDAQVVFMLTGGEKINFNKYKPNKRTEETMSLGGGGTSISLHEKITENEKFKIKSIKFDLKLLEATILELKYVNYRNPLLLISIYRVQILKIMSRKSQN